MPRKIFATLFPYTTLFRSTNLTVEPGIVGDATEDFRRGIVVTVMKIDLGLQEPHVDIRRCQLKGIRNRSPRIDKAPRRERGRRLFNKSINRDLRLDEIAAATKTRKRQNR